MLVVSLCNKVLQHVNIVILFYLEKCYDLIKNKS
nr:MAG TPA: hypothetical protein [Bacteriophage sp.]